jgi:V/A-type H+-transporting ATPase subunit E
MDIQLQELLDKIKREGVEAARAEAARLLAETEEKRRKILEDAEREARATIEKARSEAARAEASGRAALSQAARDLLLGFRGQVQALLDAAVKSDVAAAFGPELLAAAIPLAVKSLASGGQHELEALVSPQDMRKLEGQYAQRLAAELGKGVELKPHADLQAGFHIVEKGGAAYYDFSAEAVAELLSKRLNARLAELMRGSAKGL